jgi:hypothetical protein
MEKLPALLCQNPDCRQIVHPLDAPDPEDMCPECGSALDFAPDPRDPSGMTPLGTEPYPKGRIDAELLTSFETSLPKSAAIALEDAQSVDRHASALGDRGRGQPLARSSAAGSRGAQRRRQQVHRAGVRRPDARAQRAGAARQRAERRRHVAYSGPVIWRLWHDPIDDDEFYFPDGLFLTVLEGEDLMLDFGPAAVQGRRGPPVQERPDSAIRASPGSAWGKPPADDLVPLQKQLNLAQSLAFLILMHHASPRTFIPSTVTLSTS